MITIADGADPRAAAPRPDAREPSSWHPRMESTATAVMLHHHHIAVDRVRATGQRGRTARGCQKVRAVGRPIMSCPPRARPTAQVCPGAPPTGTRRRRRRSPAATRPGRTPRHEPSRCGRREGHQFGSSGPSASRLTVARRVSSTAIAFSISRVLGRPALVYSSCSAATRSRLGPAGTLPSAGIGIATRPPAPPRGHTRTATCPELPSLLPVTAVPWRNAANRRQPVPASGTRATFSAHDRQALPAPGLSAPTRPDGGDPG